MANVNSTFKGSISYVSLTPEHFSAVIALGVRVHGQNYLDESSMLAIYEASWRDNINASWVALISDPSDLSSTYSEQQTPQGYLVGFRLSLAANQWQFDKWCSPQKWQLSSEQVAYFKCNTIDSQIRGRGLGSGLLRKSIKSLQAQGAKAGVAHIWMQSPNNSAFEYFTACGGELISYHPNKWQSLCIEEDYLCPVCGNFCECTAAEMIIRFDEPA